MINNKKILSVITARGGSKGIPFKNVKPLLNKPLFIWSVLSSLKSKYVDMTLVSSNCDKVYQEFSKFNKEINYKYSEGDHLLRFSQRPDKFSTDTSKNEDALIYSMHFLREIFKMEFDIIINLQPTSPIRLNNLLDDCIEKYDNGGYDSLLTGQRITPFLWRKKDKWIYDVDKNDCCNRKMRQEIREDEFLWHDDGSIYIVDSKILVDRKCRIGYNPCIVENSDLNSLQIDTEFDFEIIENMAKVRELESLV